MTRAIGFLIFRDFQLLDAAGPIAAFEIAGRFVPGAYSLHVLARDRVRWPARPAWR
jgi:transcriptional regulator GlxA family with amidase domain